MLPVDQDIMERLEEEGILEESTSDSEEDEEPSTEPSSQTKAEQIPRSQRGRLWSSVKRLYKKLKGQDQQGESRFIQNEYIVCPDEPILSLTLH